MNSTPALQGDVNRQVKWNGTNVYFIGRGNREFTNSQSLTNKELEDGKVPPGSRWSLRMETGS